jgi:uncharacterized protein YacL
MIPPNLKLTVNLLRALFVIFAASIGMLIGQAVADSLWPMTVLGIVFGLSVVLADRLLQGVSLRIFSSATFGLFIGFLFAQLLLASDILKYLDESSRWIISLAIYGAFGYLGMMLAVRSNRDEFALIIPFVRFRPTAEQQVPVVVDTSALIDGRLGELHASGFLPGPFVVPRFVLGELHRLADSADAIRKERGRRGLEIVAALQTEPGITVILHETESDEAVDLALVQLARSLGARLLTNDANLCRLASVQGVTTLNLLDLEKVLRPRIASGETLEIALVREGKEPGQAVGYLPDGSMVVVNHAAHAIGKTVEIHVSGQVATAAGHLLFAELASRR